MSSSNILLAYGNKAPGATLAGGQWDSTLALNNLKTGKLAQVARSSNQGPYATQFRFDLAANYVLRALALVNHNLTTGALWRARTTDATLDMDFVGPTSMKPVTLTTSGGANGTRVNIYGQIEAATCPRYDFSPVNLASGTATQTISSVPAGTYLLITTGSNAAVMATGSTVSNTGTIGTTTYPAFVVVNATGNVTLTVLSAATAIHFRESLGLLVEEGRTNSALYTVTPTVADGSFTTDGGATLAAAPGILGPTGANMSLFAWGGGTQYGYTSAAFTAGTAYTYSMYARLGTQADATISMVLHDVTVAAFAIATFNLSLGTVTANPAGTAKIENMGGGLYRLSVSGTAANTGSGFYNILLGGSNDNGKGHYIGCIQLEAGAFATSYLPTTSAAVTRTADNPRISGSNFTGFYNATAGTLFVEAKAAATAATRGLASLNDNSGSNVTQLFLTSGDAPRLEVYNGASQANVTTAAVTPTAVFRVAGVYAANDFAICTNGGTVGTDSAGDVPTVSQLNLGAINGGTNQLNGHIRRITYWRTRRTNAELQTITTSGPDALGYDTGWQNALRMTFHGDTPTNWGEQYPLIATFDAKTVRYGTVEIEDTANPDNYVELGQLFVAGGFQPEHNAEYQGFGDGRTDLSSSVKSVGGQKYSTARRRPRTVDFNFPVLEQDEGDHLDEMMAEVGTTEDVLYVPDPADAAKSQRYGFLGTLREMTPLEYPFFDHRAMPLRLEQKL